MVIFDNILDLSRDGGCEFGNEGDWCPRAGLGSIGYGEFLSAREEVSWY